MALNLSASNPTPSRNVKIKCDICAQEYGVLRREHVCKRCYRSVCFDCSPHKLSVFRSDMTTKLHRVCTICFEQYSFIRKYMEYNNLNLGQNSHISKVWQKQLNCSEKKFKSDPSPTKYVQIHALWQHLNYSFRQFVGIALEKSKTSFFVLQSMLNWGLYELTKVDATIQMYSILYVYLYFLCYSQCDRALNLTIKMLFMSKKYRMSVKTIQVMLKQIGLSDIYFYKMQQYLSINVQSLADKFLLNECLISVSVALIDNIISDGSVKVTQKYIAVLLYSCHQEGLIKGCTKMGIRQLQQHLKKIHKQENEQNDTQKDILMLKQKFNKQEEIIIELKKNIVDKSHNSSKDQDNVYELLEKKNSEISLLKEQFLKEKQNNKHLRQKLQNTLKEKQHKFSQNLKEIQQKNNIVAKINLQNQSLKSMNSLLLRKMKQLGQLLMDKEQKIINDSHSKLNDITLQIKQKMKGAEIKEQINGEECKIY